MIYGINFRPKQPDTDSMGFPPGYARKFRKICRLTILGDDGKYRVVSYRLVGICETEDEKRSMLEQANNGHRKLHVETRKTAGPILYGIYAY